MCKLSGMDQHLSHRGTPARLLDINNNLNWRNTTPKDIFPVVEPMTELPATEVVSSRNTWIMSCSLHNPPATGVTFHISLEMYLSGYISLSIRIIILLFLIKRSF
jgi:hypothetical protein